jgi:copper chaperone CopZ
VSLRLGNLPSFSGLVSVPDVSIDIKTKVVTVTGTADIRDMFAAITEAGFRPETVSDAASEEAVATAVCDSTSAAETVVTLNVTGMRCMKNCGSKVQRALTALPGVSGEVISGVDVDCVAAICAWFILVHVDVAIDLAAKTVTVTMAGEGPSVDAMIAAVTAADAKFSASV